MRLGMCLSPGHFPAGDLGAGESGLEEPAARPGFLTLSVTPSRSAYMIFRKIPHLRRNGERCLRSSALLGTSTARGLSPQVAHGAEPLCRRARTTWRHVLRLEVVS